MFMCVGKKVYKVRGEGLVILRTPAAIKQGPLYILSL